MDSYRQKLETLCVLGIVFWFSGCAHFQTDREKPIGKFGSLGTIFCPDDYGIKILDVAKGSPAEKAGVKAGDVIVTADGSDLAKPENRKEFLLSVRSGNKADLSIRRKDQTIKFQILPKKADMFSAYTIGHALKDEMITGKTVSIALVATDINSSGTFPNSDAAAGWKASMKASVETYWESTLLGAAGKRCGNFSVVDRTKTNEILGELHFQMTGAVDSRMMKTVGKMTGATHLLFVSVSRFRTSGNNWSPGGWKDLTNLRLVDLESGNVLAAGRTEDNVGR